MSLSLRFCIAALALMAGPGLVAAKPCSGTNSTTIPAPTPTPCVDPPNQTTGYPDYDLFCKCDATVEKAWGNPYLGLVRCDTFCAPAKAGQREEHNDKATSLSDCMNACTGSFEKKKRQDDEYWFCHGVNYKEGELCEFFGSLGERTFTAGSGTDCFYIDGLDG
ncbi:hypothetical protein F5Y08DRAFT_311265 [Xylaria arbuscula]|nr:hypothetical protein F5Y08DRAFT_311265 [Xylaria arbuscula]